MEFMEPLLQVPDIEDNCKKGNLSGTPQAGPLVCSVKELLETKGVGEDENQWLVGELAVTLKTVGIQWGHQLGNEHKATH